MNEAKVKVSETVEATQKTVVGSENPVTKKQQEKMDKQKRDYANGMISRAEAFAMGQELARNEIQSFAEFVREPLHVNLVQTMALVDLMMEKGLFTEVEFQASLEKVSEKLQAQGEEQIGEAIKAATGESEQA